MKKQVLISTTLCLVVGLAMVSANAQTGGVKAKVPFGFTVSGQTLPAGDYRMIARPRQLNIEDGHGKIVAMVLANDLSGRSAGANGRIVFHCYGERCFLAEVWASTLDNGRGVVTSRAEQDLAREEKGKYFAVLGEELPKSR